MALVIREELHPRFERKANDLLTRVEVPLLQALTCNYVEVPLLDGDSMEVSCLATLRELAAMLSESMAACGLQCICSVA